MNNKLKFYIPIRSKRGSTALSADKFPLILESLPKEKDIWGHLLHALTLKKNGFEYRSIKILIPNNDFDQILKEISVKTGKKYKEKIIDLVLDINQLPIIQISRESEPERAALENAANFVKQQK
jgi:hypothetical protein